MHSEPASLLLEYLDLLADEGPVLDLASGDGRNGIFLASLGFEVSLYDGSRDALEKAKRLAEAKGVRVRVRELDLERRGINPLEEDYFGAVMVFRYLHRPLIPCIRKALRQDGILIYETFTIDQRRYGRPCNPDFLLNPGELHFWFEDWEVIHYFEGILQSPERAAAQIVCRKPGGDKKGQGVRLSRGFNYFTSSGRRARIAL
jgi:SAM-dependent methyltransferase